jgi:hypothetical protein
MTETNVPLPTDYKLDGCEISLVGAPIYKEVYGLPPSSNATTAIVVSMPVGEFLKDRPDIWPGPVLGVDMSTQAGVRDEKGTIKGTTRFIVYKP